MNINPVAINPATTPEAIEFKKIANTAFVATFPNSKVHKSKFERFLSGSILLALLLPILTLFSKSVKFILKKPIVSPEKKAENNTNVTIIAKSLISV